MPHRQSPVSGHSLSLGPRGSEAPGRSARRPARFLDSPLESVHGLEWQGWSQAFEAHLDTGAHGALLSGLLVFLGGPTGSGSSPLVTATGERPRIAQARSFRS